MIIIGTGKWAKLIKEKLNLLGIGTTMVGNDMSVADFNRREIFKCPHGTPVIIASKTSQHMNDLILSMSLNPSLVFVEKGFTNSEEKKLAKECLNNVPGFILSQYRYSRVFDVLKDLCSDDITKIDYTWTVEKGDPKEWGYHVLSIDNFIKNTDKYLDVCDFGFHRLDAVSDLILKQGSPRKLSIDIITTQYNYYITLGSTNTISAVHNTTKEVIEREFVNEDCLNSQLQSIFKDTNVLKLERI